MELLITVGIMGSGKSTWAKKFSREHPDVLYLSTDKIRGEIGTGEHDQSVSGKVFKLMEQKTEEAFQKSQSVLLDATFVKKSWRTPFINIARKYGAKVVAHVFKADREILIQRIQKRASEGGLSVPVHAIDRYISWFNPPTASEVDEIINH